MPVVSTVPGHCCCDGPTPPYGTLCVTVFGCCENLVPDVEVEIWDDADAVVCSGTTNDSGVFCCEELSYGDYTIHVTAEGFDDPAEPVTVDSATEDVIINLDIAADYYCGNCPKPLPSTLTLNDGFGDVTLTYDGTFDVWWGCARRTVNALSPFFYPILLRPNCNTATIGSGPYTVAVAFVAGFTGACVEGMPQVRVYVPTIRTTFGVANLDIAQACSDASLNQPPFNEVGIAWTAGTGNAGACIWGGSLKGDSFGLAGAPWNVEVCDPPYAEYTKSGTYGTTLMGAIYGTGTHPTFTLSA